MRQERLLKIIRTHHVTEKTMNNQANNTYTFIVLPTATKREIAQAIELVYQVKVTSVRTLNYKPEQKRNAKGYTSSTQAFKKELVKLAEGSPIDPQASIIKGAYS